MRYINVKIYYLFFFIFLHEENPKTQISPDLLYLFFFCLQKKFTYFETSKLVVTVPSNGKKWYLSFYYHLYGATVETFGVFVKDSHLNLFYTKISKSAGIIFCSRFYLSTKTKLLLYYSLIYPYLTYCNLTWSSTKATNLNRIFLIQKRVVRAITNAPFHALTAPLFAQVN